MIALIAVCLGVIREAPGLGVPLAVVSFIALTRTMIVSASREGGAQPLSAVEKLAVFFATISMAFVVMFCVAIALFATCYAVCAVPRWSIQGRIRSGRSAFPSSCSWSPF